jgi:acyl dehydratase
MRIAACWRHPIGRVAHLPAVDQCTELSIERITSIGSKRDAPATWTRRSMIRSRRPVWWRATPGAYTQVMKLALTIGELDSRVGQEVAVSPWVEIRQDRIDEFAKATGDFQWIHVDPERAKQSPFGATIAHGFLTLSLLPMMTDAAFALTDRTMGINYGLNKVRFTSPVPVGSKIRGRFTLARLDQIDGGVQTTWSVVVEREGGDKPVMVAETISRHFG